MQNKQISIYPVPCDLTTTFHHGASQGPSQIKAVFHQLDDSHPFSSNNYDLIFEPTSQRIIDLQSSYADISRAIIDTCNQGQVLSQIQQTSLHDINQACSEINQIVYSDCLDLFSRGPILLCGGEHGVGVGCTRALGEKHASFGVLQMDAHMDCRVQYFGYDYSHASVMTHYSKLDAVNAITQVGIRDYDASELDFQHSSSTTFNVFNDYDMKKRLFDGETWASICSDIVETLPQYVFISFDIDVLCPSLCPGTGTPVPGGLSYNQAAYLLEKVMINRQIIGAELVEVSNQENNTWDAVVGARILQLLAGCLSPTLI